MTINALPPQRPGRYYLVEGGFETEILYKHGFELPHFATFPLLKDARAVAVIRAIYADVLEIAAAYDLVPILGSFDYRASADWGALLGYSTQSLQEAVLEGIFFLRALAAEHRANIPHAIVAGYIGPRGDAYRLNRTITASEAQDYHTAQLESLACAGADLAWAMTFNNVAEAVGVTRAAQSVGIPLAVSFTLDRSARLASGHALGEAIETVDRETFGGPDFYTVNCSHPIEFEPALADAGWMRRIRSIRPNASKMEKIALCKLGYLEEGDPVELGRLMGDVSRRYPHMDILGGCCGTCAKHLREIVSNVVFGAPRASRCEQRATGANSATSALN